MALLYGIENLSKNDLEAKCFNLHRETMQHNVCVNTWNLVIPHDIDMLS